MKLSVRSLLAAASALLLAACSTQRTSLEYNPNRAHGLRAGGLKNTTVGAFKDDRGVPDVYLGQLREMGGPVHTNIETNVPVSQIVENTFGYALELRGMLAPGRSSAWLLQGTIKEFSCDQIVRVGATAEITVTLTKSGETKPAFRKSYTAENAEAAQIGSLGDVQPLKNLASATLQQLVDKALDDPELRQITDASE